MEGSAYLTTEEQRVLSRDTAEIAAKRGEEYLLQVDGSKVRDFRDADFWVTYDQSKLRFEGFVPDGVGGKSSRAAAAVTSNGKGSAGFRCEALIRTGLMWDGVVAKMRFTALTGGETEVKLNRENTGGGRIV